MLPAIVPKTANRTMFFFGQLCLIPWIRLTRAIIKDGIKTLKIAMKIKIANIDKKKIPINAM